MKVLCMDRLLPGVDPERDMGPLMREEAEAVWELYDRGIMREMYWREPSGGGAAALILETSSIEEAQEVLAGLPFNRAGLVEYDVTELRPFTPVLGALIGDGPPAA